MLHKSEIRTGFSEFSQKLYNNTKNKILKELDACDDEKIVNELCEVYKKVEEIVNQVAN
jgi:hypothetical protein